MRNLLLLSPVGEFAGDCRDDNNRYGAPEEYAARLGVTEWDIEVRSMEDRVEADDCRNRCAKET